MSKMTNILGSLCVIPLGDTCVTFQRENTKLQFPVIYFSAPEAKVIATSLVMFEMCSFCIPLAQPPSTGKIAPKTLRGRTGLCD